MGSWFACCGISKLPIVDDDEVVDFFIGDIGQLRLSGFICHSNDLWTPVTIQTYGTYADYGQIAEQPGWHVDYVTKILQKYSVELAQGDNEYHDIPIVADKMTFMMAQEAIHEGRLFFPIPPGLRQCVVDARKNSRSGYSDLVEKNVQISRMMVHRFVFEELVSWGFHTWRSAHVTVDDLIENGMDFIMKFRAEQAKLSDDLRELHRLMINFDLDQERENVFVNMFCVNESGDFYVPHKARNYLDLALDSDPADTRAIVTELAKFIIFRTQMANMQFLWSPQTGSQDDPYVELSRLYRVCDAYAQKQLHDDDEDT